MAIVTFHPTFLPDFSLVNSIPSTITVFLAEVRVERARSRLTERIKSTLKCLLPILARVRWKYSGCNEAYSPCSCYAAESGLAFNCYKPVRHNFTVSQACPRNSDFGQLHQILPRILMGESRESLSR